MARFDNFHSIFVAWMKIVLPLAALILLSTLFLISRKINPTPTLPIAQMDLQQRAQDLGITNPTFAGVMENGAEVMLEARAARPDPADMEHILADDIRLHMRLITGLVIDITSDTADIHQTDQTANLVGNVQVTTNTGYQVNTAALLSHFDRLHATSQSAVTGTGPGGDFWAGRMQVRKDAATGHTEFIFTDGVRLLYTPQATKE